MVDVGVFPPSASPSFEVLDTDQKSSGVIEETKKTRVIVVIPFVPRLLVPPVVSKVGEPQTPGFRLRIGLGQLLYLRLVKLKLGISAMIHFGITSGI